jgi:hypothetical protein
VTKTAQMQSRRVAQDGQGLFLGNNPSDPQVGDLRVRFEAVQPEPISLVAQQQGNSFTTFQAKSGGTVDLLEYGVQTAAAMFQTAQDDNRILTWVLRLVGVLVMFLGLRSLLGVLQVLAAVVPFVGQLVGFGVSLVAGLVALSLSLVTIAVAWIFYRPLLGVLLLAAAVAALFGLKLGKKPQPAGAVVERAH